MSEFYDHGAEMASEIEDSEKADGFNQYWNANHKGQPGRAEARREYNRGWSDYKSGAWESSEPRILPLLLIGVPVLVYWLLTRKKDQSSLSSPTGALR